MTGTEYDIAVVGAGIVGAACGYWAAREGFRTIVLERSRPASGTTAAGMGHVVVIDDHPGLLELTRYSQQLWREVGPALPPSAGYRPTGTVWVATNEAEVRAGEARGARLRGHGIGCRALGPDELRSLEPSLRPGLPGGLLVEDDLLVDPVGVTEYFLDHARKLGATLRSGAAVTAVAPGGPVVDGQRISARATIVASGVETPALVPELSVRPRRGVLLHLPQPVPPVRHQVAELAYLAGAAGDDPLSLALNLHPLADGTVLLGATREWIGRETTVPAVLLERLRDRARRLAPGIADLPSRETRVGFRPATPDHRPWIGPLPGRDGVWAAVGHEGLGVTASIGTGRLVVDQIAGRRPAIAPQPYLPGRAGGATWADRVGAPSA